MCNFPFNHLHAIAHLQLKWGLISKEMPFSWYRLEPAWEGLEVSSTQSGLGRDTGVNTRTSPALVPHAQLCMVCSHRHTHTHTHACMYACICVHRHTHKHECMPAHTQAHQHTHICIYTDTKSAHTSLSSVHWAGSVDLPVKASLLSGD